VTTATKSPGELLLTDIVVGFLALASPDQVPLHSSAARPAPLSQAADGFADIIAALLRPAACTVSSPACARASGSPATASPCRPPVTYPNCG